MPFILGVVGSAAQGTRRSSSGSGSYGTITGYYNNVNSSKFCSRIGNTTATVYFAGSGTKTFLQAYSSKSTIYSDTALTTLASTGIYGDSSGGGGNTWFDWQAAGWSSSGSCP